MFYTLYNVNAFAVKDTLLFAGTTGSGVIASSNAGSSWATLNNGLRDTWVRSLAASPTGLFAGTNTGVQFDGSNLASGLYFYRLQAGDVVQVRSMLVVK